MARPHDWGPSRVGHGENRCKRCFITNREAAAIGTMNECSVAAAPENYMETKLGNKYGSGDAALAIGEHAFRAGWDARRQYIDMSDEADAKWLEQAWSAYDPPEHIKELT